jgi:hypothetical protein
LQSFSLAIALLIGLTRRVLQPKNNAVIAGSLVLTVFLWGGNNAGTKWLVMSWPPVFTGCIRFILAGILLLAVLRFSNFPGAFQPLTPELRRQLWLRGGLTLAVYIAAFNWALRFTTASHVALYLGASPVWALLWEEKPRPDVGEHAALRRGPAGTVGRGGPVLAGAADIEVEPAR